MDEERDSRKIGIPRPISQILPAIRASILPKRENASETTGLPSLDRQDANSIGTQHGGTGVATSPSLPMAGFGLPDNAVTLRRSLSRLCVWAETSRFGDHGFEGVEMKSVTVRPGSNPASVRDCLSQMESLCRRCPPDLAAKKLTELRALTVSRARGETDMALMAAAYTQRMMEYPADVVVAACDGWANREEFWPSWAELKGECDKRMRGRLQIRDALRSAA